MNWYNDIEMLLSFMIDFETRKNTALAQALLADSRAAIGVSSILILRGERRRNSYGWANHLATLEMLKDDDEYEAKMREFRFACIESSRNK